MNTFRAVGVAAGLAGLSFVSLGMRGREAASAEPREYEAWIQPGKYTGFVVCSNADVNTRRWMVSLVCRGQTYPVMVTPGETVVVPFTDGWTVRAEDEARFVSKHVPFSDMADWDPLAGDEQPMVVGVWGITDKGPVALAPPKK